LTQNNIAEDLNRQRRIYKGSLHKISNKHVMPKTLF